jgi:ABC-type antimicrobial peptide transport system permease subunit
VDLAAAARGAVRSVAPGLPLYRVRPLADLLSESVARTTFILVLLGIAALVATAIGAVGIYGVLAYLVSLRAREMGLRLALGAQPGDVRRLVVGHALTDAGLGIALGLVAALLVTRVLTGLLFGVGAADPLALGSASVVLLATALAASWLPARRAAGLDPAIALREE